MKKTILLLIIFAQSATIQLFGQSSQGSLFDEEKEKAAIRAVLKRETECYWKKDYDCWQKTWSHNQALWFVYWEGLYENLSWNAMDEAAKKYFQDQQALPMTNVEWKNFQYYFMGDEHALAWYDEYSTEPNGKCTYARSIRVMEKQDGEWRILLVSGIFDPKKPCKQ